jgi:hypothetical protein
MDENDVTYILNNKSALPNKLLQADGTTTDLIGRQIVNPVSSFVAKRAIPNKFLNADGTYSTLNEIIASSVDTSIFVIVDELPAEGDPQKIYLVSDGDGGFVEYHWTGTTWDAIGTVEIDLSDYSTTQEMMNAIEASALATLNSSKAYTDTQIAGVTIDPQVFYWDGAIDATGVQFWNNVVQISKTTPVIVCNSVSNSTSTFGGFVAFDTNTFTTNLTSYTFSFTPYSLSSSTTGGDSWTRHLEYRVVVQLRF